MAHVFPGLIKARCEIIAYDSIFRLPLPTQSA